MKFRVYSRIAIVNSTVTSAILSVLLMSFAATTFADSAKGKLTELRFGSVAMDIPAVMHRRLTPLINYLNDAVGVPVSLKLSPDMKDAINNVSTGSVELAYLTPVAYLRAHSAGDAQLIAKTVTEGQGSFQLMIIVREDSPLKSVDELAGKSFAFGDKAALLQRATVVGAGIPLSKLAEYQFLGHYDNIIRGVLNKDFDAGIVKDTTAFKWEGKGIRILYRSPDLPPYNIVASKNVDKKLLGKLQKAFLALNVKNPAHKKVITALDPRYSGFAKTDDAEYDIVRKLVAPFNK